MKKFLLVSLFFILAFLISSHLTFADTIDFGFIQLSTEPEILIGQILEFGYAIATLLAILFLIIGGYEVTTSAGNPDQLETAKKRITAAVMGLVFLLASALILNTIGCGLIGIQSDIICG